MFLEATDSSAVVTNQEGDLIVFTLFLKSLENYSLFNRRSFW